MLSFHSFCVVYIHFVFISFMVFMCGSSVMHGAFRVRAVAAIMLSAIEVLYLWRISADAFAIWVFTSTILKSFSRRAVLNSAVSRPSFCKVSV